MPYSCGTLFSSFVILFISLNLTLHHRSFPIQFVQAGTHPALHSAASILPSMNNYIITLKPDTDPVKLAEIRDKVISEGGEVLHESNLIRSITVKLPESRVQSFSESPDVFFEADQQVFIQPKN